VDLGGNSMPAALDRAGPDGDVLVVDASPERLEGLRLACVAPNVFFLLGCADVLPLPDASVDAVLGDGGDDVRRVLRS